MINYSHPPTPSNYRSSPGSPCTRNDMVSSTLTHNDASYVPPGIHSSTVCATDYTFAGNDDHGMDKTREKSEDGFPSGLALQTADQVALEPDNVLPTQPSINPLSIPASPMQYSKARRWFLLLVFSLASVGSPFQSLGSLIDLGPVLNSSLIYRVAPE